MRRAAIELRFLLAGDAVFLAFRCVEIFAFWSLVFGVVFVLFLITRFAKVLLLGKTQISSRKDSSLMVFCILLILIESLGLDVLWVEASKLNLKPYGLSII